MAIFHLTAKIVSRGRGQSAVAKAAYNSRDKFTNEATGELHDYSRKGGLAFEGVFAPKDVPAWAHDRAQLWSEVERFERRKDAQLAREVEIGLPHELTDMQRKQLVTDFVRENFVRKGMVADVVIHAPPRDGDDRNHHAHILLTLRETGPDGFGKKAREWNRPAQLQAWRENWAKLANRYLERYGHEARIDHRSLEAQGIDREPAVHLGASATEFEREGKETERGDINRDIEARNRQREQLKAERDEIEQSQAAEVMRREQEKSAMSEERELTDEERRREAIQKEEDERREAFQKEEEQRQEFFKAEEERRQQAVADEEARRQEGIREEKQRKEAVRKEEEKRQSFAAEEAKRQEQAREEEARQQAIYKELVERQIEQTREMAAQEERLAIYRAELTRRAEESRHDAERRKLEAVRSLEIRNASYRYGEALGRHYDVKDPYGSLSRAAMEEYKTFLQERENLNRQIAQAKDPKELESLELRKRIESAEYMALTSDRIAGQSEIIVGRLNTNEAKHRRELAGAYRHEAKEMRAKFHVLQAERSEAAHEKIYGKTQEPSEQQGHRPNYQPLKEEGAQKTGERADKRTGRQGGRSRTGRGRDDDEGRERERER